MPPKSRKKKPTPDELLAEVRGQGPKKTYEFDDYMDVIHEMQSKKFSYGKISEFLTERLGYSITRGQVYRAYQSWIELKNQIEHEEAELARYAAMQEEVDFDPEEQDAAQRSEIMSKAAGDVLKYSLEKFPDSSLPESRVELFKRIVALLDEKARDDFDAEQADKRLEQTANGAATP